MNDAMHYRPTTRADFIARVDGLRSELLRLSLYASECLDPRDAQRYRESLRGLNQFITWIKTEDSRTGAK
jgi:hypothetical protein